MSTKTAIIATVIVIVVIGMLGCGGGLWYITQNPIRGVRTQDRAAALGFGMGIATAIPLAVIWILWAGKWRADRDARLLEEQREKRRTKRKTRRPAEDEGDDE